MSHDDLSECLLRELLDTISSGVAVYQVINDGLTGNDYIILDFNRTALELEGKRKDEVVGRPIIELRPTIDEFGLIPVFREVWKTGKPGFFPARVYIDEDFSNWYENRVFRLSNDRIVAVYDDVTHRKESERALADSEALLREVLNGMDLAVAIYEPVDDGDDFVFVTMNKFAEKITHFSLDEVVGKRISELFPEESSMGLIAKLKEAWQTGEQVKIPLTEYKDNRISQWVENTLYRVPSGKVVAVFQDTSEQHIAETALRESEEKLRSYIENAPDGFMIVDPDGRCLDVNQAATKLSGYTRDELMAMTLKELVPASAQALLAEQLNQAMETGLAVGEVPFLRKGGEPRLWNVKAVWLSEGRLMAFASDITEQTHQNEKLRELEQQYQHSQKMETVGQLAGGIAHDFNNLLTVINSYAEFVAEELHEGTPMLDDVQQILEAGSRAAALTGQLLAFSRKQILAPTVLNLNEVIGGMTEMLGRILGEDINFLTELDADLGRVSADASQIEQVLMNLTVNARDAMSKGGELIVRTANADLDADHASTHPHTIPGPYILLSVTDTGKGMTPEVMERVFEPFFTTKDKEHGTGLGLATVYGIVKQSGGNIWVTSEPGQGATFQVYLPRVEAGVSPQSEPTDPVVLRGTETILLVEDERAVRDLTRRILVSAGYKVLVGANAGEALLLCERHLYEIDLVLTDVIMPQMSGRAFADRLVKQRPDLRTLFMSGYTDDAIAKHGVLEQGTNFIAKPFTAPGLLEKIRTILDQG